MGERNLSVLLELKYWINGYPTVLRQAIFFRGSVAAKILHHPRLIFQFIFIRSTLRF
jgi:hypothetical protein